jgi:hypothetical protein
MKKIILSMIILIAVNANAQQIGNGAATVIDTFNTLLPSGMYISNKAQPNYPSEVSVWPWKYLIVTRSSVNTCEFQVSSTFLHDDRVFLEK